MMGLWYGYIRESGSIQVEKYLDATYIPDSDKSSVLQILGPFEAKDFNTAQQYTLKRLITQDFNNNKGECQDEKKNN